MTTRWRWALLVVGVAMLAGVAAIVVMGLRSGARDSAVTAAPMVTASVRIGDLAKTEEVEVSLSSAIVATGPMPDLAGARRAVITAATPNSLKPGDRVVEISGVPIFALPGSMVPFRTMEAGLSGPDVVALQVALQQLGYDIGGDQKGTFSSGTGKAVSAFYSARGYASPPGGGPGVVPFGQVMFAARFPVTPQSLGSIGAPVDGSAEVQLLEGTPSMTARPLDPTVSLTAGDHLTVETKGASVQATVESAAPTGDPPRWRVAPANGTALGDLQGASAMAGDAVIDEVDNAIIVPVTAIRGTGGNTYVQVLQGQQTVDRPVGVRLCSSGECAVTPTAEGLSTQDRVVLETSRG